MWSLGSCTVQFFLIFFVKLLNIWSFFFCQSNFSPIYELSDGLLSDGIDFLFLCCPPCLLVWSPKFGVSHSSPLCSLASALQTFNSLSCINILLVSPTFMNSMLLINWGRNQSMPWRTQLSCCRRLIRLAFIVHHLTSSFFLSSLFCSFPPLPACCPSHTCNN